VTNQQAKNVKEWIQALRSGTYRQGRNELLTNAGAYCCLGVLGKLHGCKELEDRDVELTPETWEGLVGDLPVPQEDLQALNDGPSGDIGDVKGEDGRKLSWFSFSEIADTLEFALASKGKL